MPTGAADISRDKAGLPYIALEMLGDATARYSTSEELYMILESLGAETDYDVFSKLTAYGIVVPKSNIRQARKLLDEIIESSIFTKELLAKRVKAQKTQIETFLSSGRNVILDNARSELLGIPRTIGYNETLDEITVDDVKHFIDGFVKSQNTLLMSGPSDYDLDIDFITKDLLIGSNDPATQKSIIGLEEVDIDQVTLGLFYVNRPMASLREQLICELFSTIMSAGLLGFIPERIREEHSAAYYAFYSEYRIPHSAGLSYIAAGVSSDNVKKAASLMLESMEDALSGGVDQERFETAREYLKGAVSRRYDSITSRYYSVLQSAILGYEVITYEATLELLDDISLNEVIEYVTVNIDTSKPSLFAYGPGLKSQQANLEKLVKDVS